MAESYQIIPGKEECVPGLIVPYISALENCKTNYDKLERKIEEYQKQQGKQIDELSKKLNEQKGQLKREMENIIMQLEKAVRTITEKTSSLNVESELSSLRRAIESFSKSKDDEKDILSRLVALEEKITDKGKIKELEGHIEKLKGQNESQIENLKGQIKNLQGQIENLKGQNKKLEKRIENLETEVSIHKVTELPQATGEDKTSKSRSLLRWKKKDRSRTESQHKPKAVKDESTRLKRASSSDDILATLKEAEHDESSIKLKSRSREALDQL